MHTRRPAAPITCTTIQHDAAGNPTAIVGPFGQVTALAVDANGFLKTITQSCRRSRADNLRCRRTPVELHRCPRQIEHVHGRSGRTSAPRRRSRGWQTGPRAYDERQPGHRYADHGARPGYDLCDANLAGNEQVRTITRSDGTNTQIDEKIDAGTTRVTSSDGTITETSIGPDPRFGIQAALDKSIKITLPSSLAFNATQTQSVVLSNPANPLSLVSLTDTSTVDGRSTTSQYTASTRTLVTTAPTGRTLSLTTDALGRLVSSQLSGLNAQTLTYDNRGRLTSIVKGAGEGARTHSITYNAQGFPQSVTDPIGRTAQFAYDAAGRMINQTLADGRSIGFAYDAAGNIIALMPPSRPAHHFSYSDRNELVATTPPTVPGTGATSYAFDSDRRLTTVTRPDGRSISFGYDSGGRLATRQLLTNGITTGTDTLAYDAVGRIASVSTTGGVTTTTTMTASCSTASTGPARSPALSREVTTRASGWRDIR